MVEFRVPAMRSAAALLLAAVPAGSGPALLTAQEPDEDPTPPAWAEGHGLVIGTVTRGEPPTPVPGAVVYLQDSPATAVTDSSGVFRFSLPPGAWTLLAYWPGASPDESPPGVFVTVEAGMAVRADIDLDGDVRGSATNPYTLEALEVVTRSREANDRLRDGARWDILDSDYIRSRAPASRHVGDLIRGQFAGLRVGGTAADGSLCIASLRAAGTSMQRGGGCPGMVAVVIDGMKVLDPQLYLPLIPATDIEEIRYMSGLMAGVRYGTNSENGVLLITTGSGGG